MKLYLIHALYTDGFRWSFATAAETIEQALAQVVENDPDMALCWSDGEVGDRRW